MNFPPFTAAAVVILSFGMIPVPYAMEPRSDQKDQLTEQMARTMGSNSANDQERLDQDSQRAMEGAKSSLEPESAQIMEGSKVKLEYVASVPGSSDINYGNVSEFVQGRHEIFP